MSKWTDPDDAPDMSTPYWREKLAKAKIRIAHKAISRRFPKILAELAKK